MFIETSINYMKSHPVTIICYFLFEIIDRTNIRI